MLPWKTNEFLIVTKKSNAGRNRKNEGYFFIMSKMKYIVEEKKISMLKKNPSKNNRELMV